MPPVASTTDFAWKTTKRAVLPPVAERPADLRSSIGAPLHEQTRDGALHVHLHAAVDAVLLERADHLESRAVAHVSEARVLVTAEVALKDAPVGGAVEERAPLLELLHAVRRLHRVELRHPPLVEVAAALHRVAEVHLPVVLRLDVAERRGHAALCHDRVRFAEERLAYQAHAGALAARLDGCPESGAAGADDENVVLVQLVFVAHRDTLQKSRRSVTAPLATMRM